MENTILKAEEKHKYLKELSASQLNELYQDDPFDEEVDLQMWLSSNLHYSHAMSISIRGILEWKNYLNSQLSINPGNHPAN